MDPRLLIAPPSAAPYPTPFWFIELFKVLGFSLHVWPMNLWYAGTIIAVLLGFFGRGHGRTVGKHIARILPFTLAFGVNFGIIPLLFVQVAYHQFFYPATILMAWPWFAVFWLVTLAYFGVYLYRLAINDRGPVLIGKLGGWFGAIALILVGFFFANAMSLMTRVDGWWSIFRGAQTAGAATGLALNTSDPTLIPRWLFMFGLALTSTAAFIIIDAAFLSDRDGADYKRYAGRFALALYTLGILWFAGFGSWYIFGTRAWGWEDAMCNPLMKYVFPITAIAPGLPWLLILLQWKAPTRLLAVLAGIAQFGVIALNAVSRQWLQNTEIARFTDIAARPVHVQTSVLVTFLLLFVFGVGVITWMVSKIVQVNREEAAQ
jgi:hypothetical protein